MGLVELVELEIAQRTGAECAEVALMRRARIVYRRVGVAGEIDYLRVVYKNIRYLVLAPVDTAVDSICNVRVLKEEYPALAQKLRVMLPDENFRRVGQSMAAASLPEV